MPQCHTVQGLKDVCACACVWEGHKKKKLHMLKLQNIFQGSKVSGRAG